MCPFAALVSVRRETSLSRTGPARKSEFCRPAWGSPCSFVEGWSSGYRPASHWLATIPRLKKQAARPSVSAPISTVAPGRREVIRLLQCIRSTDHRRDAISDFIAGVHHEVRPQVFLDRPLRRGLAGTGVHIRTVREANPTCDDFFNKTLSIRPAGRVRAHRTARRAFDFAFKAKPRHWSMTGIHERCSPCNEGAIHPRVDDDLHGHPRIAARSAP